MSSHTKWNRSRSLKDSRTLFSLEIMLWKVSFFLLQLKSLIEEVALKKEREKGNNEYQSGYKN